MVTSRTPLRMSFVGGGTDFPNYYKTWGGEVISTTIDSYITVTVQDTRDGVIYLDYLDNEEVVNSVAQIKHDILRECLRYYGIEGGICITVTTTAVTRATAHTISATIEHPALLKTAKSVFLSNFLCNVLKQISRARLFSFMC